MPSDMIPEPRIAMAWPHWGRDIPRAGTPQEQIAWQDRAWTMLEAFAVIPVIIRTRLSNEWLGERGWRAQIVGHYRVRDEDWDVTLAAAAQRRGHQTLLGTVVGPGELRASAVCRLPTDADALSRFFGAHYIFYHVLFPEDLSFAVHANDGDFAVYAGPEAFLRDALPPEAIGAAATAYEVEGVEQEHGAGCMDSILAHYRPFMLE